MARVCQITGKKASSGNNVSHSVRRTKRRFQPNLQKKRMKHPLTGKIMKMLVSTRALRTMMKPSRKK